MVDLTKSCKLFNIPNIINFIAGAEAGIRLFKNYRGANVPPK